MFSPYFNGAAVLLTAALISNPQVAGAAQIRVEGEPLAKTIVIVTPADLVDRAAVAKVERQLRRAAKTVCDEQYPQETESYYVFGCYSGTFRDAMDQLRSMRKTELAGRKGSTIRLAVAIRPH